MIHATGGGLPAHVFQEFMTGAEQNLPVRPLTGAYIAANLPDDAPAPKADNKKPGTIESILNGLFGG